MVDHKVGGTGSYCELLSNVGSPFHGRRVDYKGLKVGIVSIVNFFFASFFLCSGRFTNVETTFHKGRVYVDGCAAVRPTLPGMGGRLC